MKAFTLAAALAAALVSSPLVHAQTFTSCSPLVRSDCPPDPALGKSISVDFTQGSSDYFPAAGSPARVTYASDGAHFTVAQSGDSPQVNSNFYIMFGRVEVRMKAAPGVGIVSSLVLESDVLDEVDWEWIGSDPNRVQSNYFGKGFTGSYNRGAFHSVADHQQFHTYAIDWTKDAVLWEIDGVQVRSLTPQEATDQYYPQTPMKVKLGAWSGGDPANSPGTIEWAGGPTNYGAGPFTMVVASVNVHDYSTGTQYVYNGNSGAWTSIQAVGGSVYGGSSGTGSSPPPVSTTTAIESATSIIPVPFPTTLTTSYSASIPQSTVINPCPEGQTCSSYESPSNSGRVLISSSSTQKNGGKPTSTSTTLPATTNAPSEARVSNTHRTSSTPQQTSLPLSTSFTELSSATQQVLAPTQSANAASGSMYTTTSYGAVQVLAAVVAGLGVGAQVLF